MLSSGLFSILYVLRLLFFVYLLRSLLRQAFNILKLIFFCSFSYLYAELNEQKKMHTERCVRSLVVGCMWYGKRYVCVARAVQRQSGPVNVVKCEIETE